MIALLLLLGMLVSCSGGTEDSGAVSGSEETTSAAADTPAADEETEAPETEPEEIVYRADVPEASLTARISVSLPAAKRPASSGTVTCGRR